LFQLPVGLWRTVTVVFVHCVQILLLISLLTYLLTYIAAPEGLPSCHGTFSGSLEYESLNAVNGSLPNSVRGTLNSTKLFLPLQLQAPPQVSPHCPVH